jgi:hypothetical protein
MNNRQEFCIEGSVVTAVAGCGRSLTARDVLMCLLPVSFFLSIVSLV